MAPILRTASVDDLPAMLEIEQQSHYSPWKMDTMARYVKAPGVSWVLADGDTICAYAIATHVLDEAELLNITVNPQYRKQGLGRRMLDHVIDAVMADGCVRLFLEVRPSNSAAIALHENSGFCQVGVRPNYYPKAGGYEDALLYCQELGL